MNSSSKNCINVGIYDGEKTIFHQYSDELSSGGYQLSFNPELTPHSIDKSDDDICIINIAKLDGNTDFLHETNTPFLVSGVSKQIINFAPNDIFKHSVGLISNEPSLEEICINIRLGLLWYDERKKYSDRIEGINEKFESNRITGIAIGLLMSASGLLKEDILEDIKVISRNKQRRIPDVANEIILILQSNKDIDTSEINSREKFKSWLDNNIASRKTT